MEAHDRRFVVQYWVSRIPRVLSTRWMTESFPRRCIGSSTRRWGGISRSRSHGRNSDPPRSRRFWFGNQDTLISICRLVTVKPADRHAWISVLTPPGPMPSSRRWKAPNDPVEFGPRERHAVAHTSEIVRDQARVRQMTSLHGTNSSRRRGEAQHIRIRLHCWVGRTLQFMIDEGFIDQTALGAVDHHRRKGRREPESTHQLPWPICRPRQPQACRL
jgi:hypothetical protein